MGLLPCLFYFCGFCLLTFPLITRFSTHFFCDAGDGYQNVWNIWWINKAVTQLHQHPWYTRSLHYPHGTSLIGQTMNPFNGFVCIPLLRFLTLVQAHNVMVLFSFVVAGLNAFLLAYHVSRSYGAALVGGGIFTFCSFHFAHAQGHLQLVSLEWIPLFLLCWHLLLHRPRVRTAVAAAISLFLVILCDYYYFFCCVLAAGLMVLYYAARNWRTLDQEVLGGALARGGTLLPRTLPDLRRSGAEIARRGIALLRTPLTVRQLRELGSRVAAIARRGIARLRDSKKVHEFRRRYARPLALFFLVSLLTSGPLASGLVLSSIRDPFAIGGHPPRPFSMDLLAPFIPGGHWRFHALTRFYWSRLPAVIHEHSVYVGLSVVSLLAYAWRKRRLSGVADLGLWYFVLLFFAVMSLGPALRVWGKEVFFPSLPYAWAEVLFPPIQLGGVPVRFMVMTMLCAGVLAAVGLEALRRSMGPRGRLLTAALLALMVVEYLPRPMPATSPVFPPYVEMLRRLPGKDAVLDLLGDEGDGLAGYSLFYQTVYDKPQVFGYISRTPRSVKRKNNRIRRQIYWRRWSALWTTYRIRYLIAPRGRITEAEGQSLKRLYQDGRVEMYDLAGPGAPPAPPRPSHL
jgi:hypothetical protein